MRSIKSFDGLTDRYNFDYGACSVSKGFAQVDTDQDASYFGTWANPFKLIIVSYIEGDIRIDKAESTVEFKEALESLRDWNRQQGFKFIGIDPGFDDALKNQFVALGLGSMLH